MSIVVIGVVLRLYHLQFYLENGGLDAIYYIHAAVKYLNGNWFTPSATFKGPLLTLALTPLLKIFGPTYIATKLVSLLAGSLLPIITFLVGSELFGKKIGFSSALIVSIDPLLIFYHGLVYRETLFSLTWMTCIYFALRGFKGHSFYAIAGGIFFALASLTIELGIFGGVGFILFFIFEKISRSKKTGKLEYQNLDMFLLGAFLTLVPFLVKNDLTYNDPFKQWFHLEFFQSGLPFSASMLMWAYLGLMALSVPYIIALRMYHVHSRSLRKLDHFFLAWSKRHSRKIKISLTAFLLLVLAIAVIYDFLRGPGPVTRISLGLVKLSEVLIFPEALGFLLVFSLVAVVYSIRSSKDVFLVICAFIFSTIGLAWGITTHYLTVADLEFNEILPYYPYGPLDNAFRYVSSYVPLLAIFACYGIFLLVDKSTHKLVGPTKKKARKACVVKTFLLSALVLAASLQFAYGDTLLRAKAQRDFGSLQEKYDSVVNWLSERGSPVVYGFNPVLEEVYGKDRVVLLTDETLMEIARRASNEYVEFIVSDVFGVYSEAQLALFFGGLYEDSSFIRLNRFSLARSYKGWPSAQIFMISEVEINQTALVVQHEDWGQEWVSLLSENYLVDTVDDEEDLTTHFVGAYKLIVLTEIRRTLTDTELNTLQQQVESGGILIVNGLSPAYMNLETNGYWIGARDFVEAPKEAKWNLRFTESALSISSEIELDKSYALYTSSLYSSPTGLTGIEEEVVVYASRVEDGAVAIYAKPYVDGAVIFSGVRPSYATAAEHYGTYINFVVSLLEKANERTLFP